MAKIEFPVSLAHGPGLQKKSRLFSADSPKRLRVPAVDYFRRGPRPEELFFVFGRDGLQALVRTYLEEERD